jgi:hypothetical protein
MYMKKITSAIHWLIFAAGIITGLYVGGWLMFIQPILEACEHFDAGTLTGVIIGNTILKCACASAVGTFIVWASSLIATLVAAVVETISNKPKKRGK